MSDKLQITRSGEVEHWTLHDPATRNALTDELVAALAQACERAAQDPALRFVVLQGSGGAFCAGGSLGGFAQAIGQALPPGQTDPLIAMNAGFGHLLGSLCALPQMLLVAVDGPAMGGGLGLLCCGDFVLATPSAVFAAPEITLGVVPAQIAPFVHRRLGDRLARQLMLSGEKLVAQQALAQGLVDEVADDLPAAVARRISALRRAAPGAVAHTKALLYMLNQAPALDFPAQAAIKFAANLRSPEAAEGLAAFAKKRKPGWAA
ncbi:MAG: enoyl-CoA hydratase-related protein [Polaromonas sp.]|uniref:enoyl-CoA hydratase/isomerase family protein n=1 Tax=Polaromonas sp. TaxID=1869339 RepID=UPI002727F9FE|nr:enoyl-CoA hydratase-related protein [Polaromonas sp.]MDO9112992.1 enoyl-CoA hydratase-related protein [Polaromonas sp.]MDP1886265.1 enoyl-CoA hydratase-related protein [Polaromonas sp.]